MLLWTCKKASHNGLAELDALMCERTPPVHTVDVVCELNGGKHKHIARCVSPRNKLDYKEPLIEMALAQQAVSHANWVIHATRGGNLISHL